MTRPIRQRDLPKGSIVKTKDMELEFLGMGTDLDSNEVIGSHNFDNAHWKDKDGNRRFGNYTNGFVKEGEHFVPFDPKKK